MSDENSSGKVSRRQLLGGMAKASAIAAAASVAPKALADAVAGDADTFDYVVVGSGAGGGPVACNLAKAGFRVCILEAGTAPSTRTYSVPVFHGLSTEDPAMAWNFYVNHYSNAGQAAHDSKMVAGKGILYPRAGTLGGCTAHNAMITLYPDNRDWDNVATLTGDQSWHSQAMRSYYQRVEQQHFENKLVADDPSREEGNHGWLTTEQTGLKLLLTDKKLIGLVLAAAQQVGVGKEILDTLVSEKVNYKLDPNEAAYVANKKDGVFRIPKATRNGRRNGTRELILNTLHHYSKNLVVRDKALATKVLFADGGTKAVGVEYLSGQHLYRADPNSSQSNGTVLTKRVMARHEVILAGGAFNTPQLLMLSGVGPRADLERLHIPVKVALEGVGKNLQDRYEVGVVTQLTSVLNPIKDCTFNVGNDPCLKAYDKQPLQHVYASNGVVLATIKRSTGDKPDPDLVIFGVPGRFAGYKPGWARQALQKDRFTWLILKGHTHNTAGSVTLKSADPRDTPHIDFKYFDEGSQGAQDDLDSVVAGIKHARKINGHMEAKIFTKQEEVPGPHYKSDDELRTFVKNEAWGHHASCTNKIGAQNDPTAVLDSKFRVHGTQGLRVVDASVFPKIPGLFIVAPTYMIAEKASDDIIKTARGG